MRSFVAILVVLASSISHAWTPTWKLNVEVNNKKTSQTIVNDGSPIYVTGVDWLCRFNVMDIKELRGKEIASGVIVCGVKSDPLSTQVETTAGCTKEGRDLSGSLVLRSGKNVALIEVSCK